MNITHLILSKNEWTQATWLFPNTLKAWYQMPRIFEHVTQKNNSLAWDLAHWIECLFRMLKSLGQSLALNKLCMEVHACNLTTEDMMENGSQVQEQEYTRTSLKKTKQKRNESNRQKQQKNTGKPFTLEAICWSLSSKNQQSFSGLVSCVSMGIIFCEEVWI